MVYSAALGQIVLFGGKTCMQCGPVNDATWVFDGKTWTECICSGPRPDARTSPGMGYDPRAQPIPRVVMFGGAGDGGGEPFGTTLDPFGDTWLFGGNPADPSWVPCPLANCPEGSPSARGTPELSFDEFTSEMVMFGGQSGMSLGDTWFFDRGQAVFWDQCDDVVRCPADKPGPRFGHRMTYDKARNQILLFGAAGPTIMNDWFWTGSPGSWIQCGADNGCTTTPPLARCCVGLAYDEARQNVVLHGGGFLEAPNAYPDTWTWDPVNSWRCRKSCGL